MVAALVSNEIGGALAEFGIDEHPELVCHAGFVARDAQQARNFTGLRDFVRHEGVVYWIIQMFVVRAFSLAASCSLVTQACAESC